MAEPLGLDVVDAAWGIERIVNANMANATRRVLAGYGADARELAMIAYGGNGAVHAWAIAEELGVRRVIVPEAAPVFSALGLLVADYRGRHPALARAAAVAGSTRPRSRSCSTSSRPRPGAELDPAGLPDDAVDVRAVRADGLRRAELRHERSRRRRARSTTRRCWTWPARFHDAHEADRGFAFRNQEPVVRGVRCLVVGGTPKPESLAPADEPSPVAAHTKDVWSGAGYEATRVLQAGALAAGDTVSGPALIEERFTVVAVPPGWTATLGTHDSWELERRR